jgi:hypothetical protein
MEIVAVLAVGLGMTLEWWRHRQLDRFLFNKARLYRQAALHQHRAMECQARGARKEAYPGTKRLNLFADEPGNWMAQPRGFESWDQERDYHLYWANRLYDQAEPWDDRMKSLEKRLLMR